MTRTPHRLLMLVGRRVRGDHGLGLIEVMVSLTLFSVIMTGVGYGLTQSVVNTRGSKNREAAANIASATIDKARATTDFATLASDTWTQNVDNDTYTILQTVTDQSGTGNASPCDGGSSTYIRYKRVSVRVDWVGMGDADPIRSDTLLTPGEGSFDPATGNIGTKITDATGNPVEGVEVILSGPESADVFTDDKGCAFVDSLTAGSYTVTASKSGYVTPQGASSPSQSSSVSSGSTTQIAFEMDEAATLRLNLPTGAFPAVTTGPVSIANSTIVPNGKLAFAGSGTTRVLSGRYPFASGYEYFAGACADADPEGASGTGPFYVGGNRAGPVAMTAGGTSTATIPMAQVSVRVQTSLLAVPVAGAVVTVTHDAVSDPQCPTGETYTLPATDATGTVQISLPWGKWLFTTALPGSSNTSYTLDPTVSGVTAALVTVS